jgi:hypothetical protein
MEVVPTVQFSNPSSLLKPILTDATYFIGKRLKFGGFGVSKTTVYVACFYTRVLIAHIVTQL